MLKTLIRNGETEEVEFKTTFNVEAIESLVAFANRKGGTVWIGVAHSKVVGVALGAESLPQWINEIKGKTEPSLVPDAEIMDYEGKRIVAGRPENIERWQYPLDAIREVVLNMIVHRDYRSSTDSVIKVFDDRIEFFNPGSLPEGLNVAALLSGNYRSTPRNRAVATLFKELGLIEKYGSGIRRILDLCRAQGLKSPLFESTSQGFVATLFAAPSTTQVATQVEALLSVLNTGEALTRSELMERMGLANREHFRKAYLEEALKSGRLERTVPDKPNSRNQRYRVIG